MPRLEVFKIKLLRVPVCKELDKVSKLKIRSGLFYSSKAHEMDESALRKSCHFSHFRLDEAPSVSSMAPTHSLYPTAWVMALAPSGIVALFIPSVLPSHKLFWISLLVIFAYQPPFQGLSQISRSYLMQISRALL